MSDRNDSASSSARVLEGLRVLVVDDDEEALDLMTIVLRKRGADVLVASSAQEGFDTLVARRPHVLVSDVGMPIEDGHSLLRRVRALRPDEGGKTPALALTAFGSPQDRADALAAGFDRFLTKPVDVGDLVTAVLALFEQSSG